jgi:RNA polymerase subunit RPABC4/transcription elongation factor Spt4
MMTLYSKCSECGEEVTEDSDFCPHCGALFSASEGVFCDTHQSAKATGVCIVCRKLVCRQCAKSVHGRTFCLDHQDVEVQQDWAVVFVSTEINDAELVKAILEKGQFRVLVQNFGSVGYAWDGGGDSPQSRSNLGRPAKVFVPIPEFLEAVKAVEEWKASEVDERAGDEN